ncbi:MAG: hypothetical protein QOG85_1979 [Gaiellaceae bacterium]|jgi:hypothetical protein|nr:hypothetical protein [Gaiellaceae bacterium]
MRQRRFLLLTAVLVVLNTALWLAPQGLAFRQLVVSTLFGKNMMRADVTMASGMEWRVDRGTIVTNTSGILTLHEIDGRVQPITVSSTTRVYDSTGATFKLSTLKPGWRVLVIWPALSGPADSVKIEKRTTT